jgi:membrane-associated phospholipid phosphatase
LRHRSRTRTTHTAAPSLALFIALLIGTSATPLAAQSTTRDSSVQKTFFVPKDALLLGGFALASYGISVFDDNIALYFQDPARQHNNTMSDVATAFTKIQETTLTLGGIATYGIARLVGSPDVADVAFHATEAVVLASLTSQVIRGPLGRARPQVTRFRDQYEFKAFKGFSDFDYRAYPSIHTSSAFAAATVIVAEVHRRSPKSTWYVAPLAYGLAAGPGYARMFLGQHWASDVFMGAFMGTFYGLRVVSYNHDHPDNRVDRFFLGAPNGNGLKFNVDSRGVGMTYARQF